MSDTAPLSGVEIEALNKCSQCGIAHRMVAKDCQPELLDHAKNFGEPWKLALRCRLCWRVVFAIGREQAIARWNSGVTDGALYDET